MDEEQLNDVELEDDSNIITLEAEGEAVEFEYIDTLDYEGEEYVVLLPVEEYVSVDSEEVLNTLFDMFKEQYADEFDFVEE